MNNLRKNQKGIVGLILLGVAVLIFIFFVGKRVWDANQDDATVEQSSPVVMISKTHL